MEFETEAGPLTQRFPAQRTTHRLAQGKFRLDRQKQVKMQQKPNSTLKTWQKAFRLIHHTPLMKLGSLALCALLLAGACVSTPVFTAPAQAQLSGYGFSPQRFKDGTNYGVGIYFAPYDVSLYSQPSERSPLVAEFHWQHKSTGNSVVMVTPGGSRKSVAADKVFFSFYPQLDVAMMAVSAESEDGWVEVIYDQAHQKTGWVHLKDAPADKAADKTKAGGQALAPLDTGEPSHFGVYQSWPEFMKLNAKSSGIYWLSGVKEYYRAVHSSDSDDAKLVPITIIRNLKVKHLRGNWLLVEVLDFENNTPIGWVRWRDDDGNLMVFPNINQQFHPVVIGGY